MNKAIMHINFAEIRGWQVGDKTIDDICKMAAEVGADGIEFRGTQPRELAHISFREYVEQIAASKKKYGLSEILFGITVADCANRDSSVREKAVEEAIRKMRLVNDFCGTAVCNGFAARLLSPILSAPDKCYEFHGSAAATREEWDLTVDSFQKIGKELETLGMKFAFETHMCYLHDTPAAAKKLVDLIDSPAVGLNMDYGNTVYFKEHPEVGETIDLYGDKLFYTHLKNSIALPGTPYRIATALCDGQIDHRRYLKKLKAVGFDGPIGIEAPRSGDRRYYAEKDFTYYRWLVKEIGGVK